jgi:hypothetical protein
MKYEKHEAARKEKVNTLNLKRQSIPMFAGRPDRETVIGSEDLCNLTIALGLYQDVNEFVLHI